ncbi:MAG: FAD-dependent oxidoreductase [Bacillota bacterium]
MDAIDLDAAAEEKEIQCGSVILATGFRPFPAETMMEYGYGQHPDVITAYELEGDVGRERDLAEYLDGRGRVAFIQCVGSRDQHNNSYCSRVCCAYALRLARLIRSEVPEAEVTLYFMDIQSFGEDWLDLHRACIEDDGIDLVRGKPARVNLGDSLSVVYEDVRDGERRAGEHDLLVLSVGIQPGDDTRELGHLFGVSFDQHGFFAGGDDGVQTVVPGLFLAGTCEGPRDIKDSMAHARRAARRAISSLRSRSLCETE